MLFYDFVLCFFVLILLSNGPHPTISARRGRGMRIKKKGLEGGITRKRMSDAFPLNILFPN